MENPPVIDADQLSRTPDDRVFVVFDTDCVLCSRWVSFLLRHERDQRMIFVSAWSSTGLALASKHALSRADLNLTYLVIENSRPLTHSAAGLALVRRLKAPWRWLAALVVVPRPLRDRLYNWVARNRYAWFGRKDHCFVPPPGAQRRFVED
jgi:predicted DCC family thiol-disulfide oxidoreductase YuxK